MKPRIYVYKITFLDAPYYYYGVHKEKRFDEYYMGTPVTHKKMWEIYTPKKQIIQVFENTTDGWLKANKLEKNLIRPVYNKDQYCLNENCGGVISLNVCRTAGLYAKVNKKGIHGASETERIDFAKKGGITTRDKKCGIHANTSKQHSTNAKKAAKITNSLRYQCTVTKMITNPGALTHYQKARHIDPSNRIRLVDSH